MSTAVLVGHFLTPHGDGPAFISTEAGTARDFGTVKEAWDYIGEYELNKRAPVWSVYMLVEVPDGYHMEPSADYERRLVPVSN